MKLAENTILLTGIGRGRAEAFHALGHNVIIAGLREEVGSHGGRSSAAPCGMRHPSPAARAIRNNPAPTTTAPMARATRSLAGARRSTVMAAVTTSIACRRLGWSCLT